MDNLQNVEKFDAQQKCPVAHKQPMRFRQALKYGVVVAAATVVANANAAMPDVDVTDILTYIGLLVAAVATVASASLMIFLAAKGIKALRTAF